MLLKLDYIPINFNPSRWVKLQQPATLIFSFPRLLWSAITVGRANWRNVVQSGIYSVFEIVYRSSLLLANLQISKIGKLTRSSAYKSLDPSEKSAISYFMGLTSAKLIAQKLCGVHWLMHLDVYWQILNPQIPSGGSRPDLVGCNKSSQWMSFEAKGRTHGADSRAKTTAKGQASQIGSINGTPLYLGVGLISYFNSNDELEIYLKDPPPKKGFSSLELKPGTFFSDYYRGFVDLINSDYSRPERIAFRDRTYIVKYVEEMDSRIGIDEEVYKHTLDQTLEKVIYTLPESSNEPENPTSQFVGEDGIFVELGQLWTSRFAQH